MEALTGIANLGTALGSINSGRRTSKRQQKIDQQNAVFAQQQAQENYYFMRARNREDYYWNLEREREDQAYQWTNYDSPAARRKALEDAGYSADLLSENSGSGGSSGVGMPASSFDTPPAPSVDYAAIAQANTDRAINAITQASTLLSNQERVRDESRLRKQQIEAGQLDLAAKRLAIRNSIEDFNRGTYRFAQEKLRDSRSAWKFNREAYIALRDDQEALFDNYHKRRMADLSYFLNQEALDERRWRNAYIKRYGHSPEKGYTFSDFLADIFLGDNPGDGKASLGQRYAKSFSNQVSSAWDSTKQAARKAWSKILHGKERVLDALDFALDPSM